MANPQSPSRSSATYNAVSAPSEGEESKRLWTMLKETSPCFADHEAKTARTIPVVVLTRV